MNPAFLGSTVKKAASGGGGGGGTYSNIAHAIANGGSGTITTSGVDTTTANLTVIVLNWYSGTETITDSNGNSYTALTKRNDGSTYNGRIYYCINPIVGASHTASVSGVAFGVINFYAFKLSSGTPAFDAESGVSIITNTDTKQPGSITPSGSNGLFILGSTWSIITGTPTASVDSGFSTPDQTQQGAANLRGMASYLIATTGTAVNPTITYATTINDGELVMAAFK